MTEVVDAARRLEPRVMAIIITGEGGKAFAAGADIKELAQLTYEQVRASVTHRTYPKRLNASNLPASCSSACWATHLMSCHMTLAASMPRCFLLDLVSSADERMFCVVIIRLAASVSLPMPCSSSRTH